MTGCEDGWIQNENTCYLFTNTKKSFQEGLGLCPHSNFPVISVNDNVQWMFTHDDRFWLAAQRSNNNAQSFIWTISGKLLLLIMFTMHVFLVAWFSYQSDENG